MEGDAWLKGGHVGTTQAVVDVTWKCRPVHFKSFPGNWGYRDFRFYMSSLLFCLSTDVTSVCVRVLLRENVAMLCQGVPHDYECVCVCVLSLLARCVLYQ